MSTINDRMLLQLVGFDVAARLAWITLLANNTSAQRCRNPERNNTRDKNVKNTDRKGMENC
eukprot:2322995-Amphidinium_carterae.1